MKKIYTLIASLLLLCTGNAKAQTGWDYDPTALEEIIPGDDKPYVIRHGIGPNNTSHKFLNSGNTATISTIDATCIFNFIKIEEKKAKDIETGKEEVFNIYILKNVDNGKYISDNGERYTSSPMEAFTFCARKAVARPMIPSEWRSDINYWHYYSNAINGDKCPGAEGVNWVFCHPDMYKFMAITNNPGWSTNYITSTNWEVYKAFEKAVPAATVLETTIKKFFKYGEPNEYNYPVGNEPGCISQAYFNELDTLYVSAWDAVNNPKTSEAKCMEFIKEIEETFARMNQEIHPMRAGYYTILNEEKGLFNIDEKANCDKTTEIPTQWNKTNAKYAWELVPAEGEGQFFIKNVGTEQYLGNKSHNFRLTKDTIDSFSIPSRLGRMFYIFDGQGYLNAKKDGSLTNWADLEGAGNHWTFNMIDTNVMDSLSESLHKLNLNKDLRSLAIKCENDIEALKNNSGMTMNGEYSRLGGGLVSDFNNANATYKDSKTTNAFDKDPNTHYITIWQGKGPDNQRHWVQMDLGNPHTDLYLKMTRREMSKNNVTGFELYEADGDSANSENWSIIHQEDTVIYTYPTLIGDSARDSMTYITKIVLNHPVQHLRFTASKTTQQKFVTNGGPVWNFSEFRLYDANNCGYNKKYDLIPAALIENLKTVIAKAKQEVKDTLATQETYDELQAAMDTIWASYPDPASLINSIESYNHRIETAAESDTSIPGYYQPNAIAEFKAVIDNIAAKAEDEAHPMTLEEIEQNKIALNEGFKQFQAKLYLPEEGTYRIVSQAISKPDIFGNYLASANANVDEAVVYGYQNSTNIGEHWNTIWEIKKNEENKFSFKNLATGLYINNPYEGLTEEEKKEIATTTTVTFSKEPKYIQLEASAIPGQFLLALDYKRFINASSKKKVGLVGRPMAIWSDFMSETSRVTFEKVSNYDLEEWYSIECTPGEFHIITLPIAVCEVSCGSFYACKVLGLNGDKIILQEYDVADIIPAGTPFVIKSGETDNTITTYPVPATLDELAAYDGYCYEKKVQNGLVSAPIGFEIEPGYGVIFLNKVNVTVGGEPILSGTGFFNNEIPTTTENGKYYIPVNGKITGVGTAIEKINTKNNATHNVYTISGVKVRQNISGTAATQGLPKGIYIVGGKKYIVK